MYSVHSNPISLPVPSYLPSTLVTFPNQNKIREKIEAKNKKQNHFVIEAEVCQNVPQ